MSAEGKKIADLVPAALTVLAVAGAAGQTDAKETATAMINPADAQECVITKRSDINKHAAEIRKEICQKIVIAQGPDMTPEEAVRIEDQLANLFGNEVRDKIIHRLDAGQVPASFGCSAQVTAPAGSRVTGKLNCVDPAGGNKGGGDQVVVHGNNYGDINTGDQKIGTEKPAGDVREKGFDETTVEDITRPKGEPSAASAPAPNSEDVSAAARPKEKPPVPTDAPQYKDPSAASGAPGSPSAAPAIAADKDFADKAKENWELGAGVVLGALGVGALWRKRQDRQRKKELRKLEGKPDTSCSPAELKLKLLHMRIKPMGRTLTDTEAALFYGLGRDEVDKLLEEGKSRFGIIVEKSMAERMRNAASTTNPDGEWNTMLKS